MKSYRNLSRCTVLAISAVVISALLCQNVSAQKLDTVKVYFTGYSEKQRMYINGEMNAVFVTKRIPASTQVIKGEKIYFSEYYLRTLLKYVTLSGKDTVIKNADLIGMKFQDNKKL